MTRTEQFVNALSEMMKARGILGLNEEERTVLCDAFMDAVNAEVDDREKAARSDW